MANPVESLYGSYNPFDHARAQVLDPELNMYAPLDYVVPAGPANRVYDTIQSSTQTSTQTMNIIRQCTLEDLTSSWMTFRPSVSLKIPSAWGFVSKVSMEAYITAGNLFLGQFPLQQAATNIQAIIAGTTVSLDPSTLASYLLRGYRDLNINPYIQQFPSVGDSSAQYVSYSSGSGLFHPNALQFDLPPKVQSRNMQGFDWAFIENTPPDVNCQGVTITWEEPPLIDLFSLSRDSKPCFSGINQLQFILTFAAPASKLSDGTNPGQPLERVFSGVKGALISASVGGPFTLEQLISQSAITFSRIPEMRFIQYTQNVSWNLYNMYSRPYTDFYTGYQTQNIDNIVIPQVALSGRQPQTEFTVSMNSQTITEIPKMFVIWTGLQGSYRRAWDAAWSGVPLALSARFAGTQNLLASAPPRELWALSVKNGLNMTWLEAQMCGFPLFLLPSDLGLSAGALCLEGVTGSFQIQIQTLRSITPQGFNTASAPLTLTNMQVHMIPVYSVEFQINNNRANVVQVARMDVSNVESIPFIDSSNANVEGLLSGGSLMAPLKSGFRRLVSLGRDIAPHLPALYSAARPIVEEVVDTYKRYKGSGATRRLQYR